MMKENVSFRHKQSKLSSKEWQIFDLKIHIMEKYLKRNKLPKLTQILGHLHSSYLLQEVELLIRPLHKEKLRSR